MPATIALALPRLYRRGSSIRPVAVLVFVVLLGLVTAPAWGAGPPNVLLAIADDQSWAHTSAAGFRAVLTPAFDRVARAGVRFTNAIAGSPGCSPSRASLLTGRQHWQLEQAGTHASSFPATYVTYPDLLERAGYVVGCTGKGWGPGNWKISGRKRNPAGPAFDDHKTDPPLAGIGKEDYAANFAGFLARRPAGKPFCFWYGGHEPHRKYEEGGGLKAGMRIDDVAVPPFLPDTPEVRSDILDYCAEIEWFDDHLGRMLDLLDKAGELANTLVIVTADNGMSFPGSKANTREYGIHVPLAIAWPDRVPGARVVDNVVGFVDLAATILDAAGVTHPGAGSAKTAMVGQSLMSLLTATARGRVAPGGSVAFSGRERHSSARHDNLGYPSRALRTDAYLYVRNFHPERWPAGDPREIRDNGKLGPQHGAYHDIDGCPTLDFLVAHRDDPEVARFFHLAVDRRPAEELFDVVKDPGCLNNLAEEPAFADVRARLRDQLDAYLKRTGDPRVGPDPEIWETYPRYSPLRNYPAPPAS
jgi:N-sulfoglucosamine sulfohydrolase